MNAPKLGLSHTTIIGYSSCSSRLSSRVLPFSFMACSYNQNGYSSSNVGVTKQPKKKGPKVQLHLWKKKNYTGTGKKANELIEIISKLPNEKEAVYGALDEWTVWDVEFPFVAAAKALRRLRDRREWKQAIMVGKWLLNKGECMTMGTYDTLILAFDAEGRVEEAELLWNVVYYTHTRAVPKKLFSRMISLYSRRNMYSKVIEVFGCMEEMGINLDETTVENVASAFENTGELEKKKMVMEIYSNNSKFINHC